MTEVDARTRILDAAEVAFANSGLAGARVAAITEAAGVNKAMLYYYFGSKADLYLAVLDRVVDEIQSHALSALDVPSEDPVVRLESFLDGYRDVLRAHPNFARIMVREIIDGGPRVGPLFRERMGPLVMRVAMEMQQMDLASKLNPEVTFPLAGPAMISPFIFIVFARPLLEQVFGPLSDDQLDAYHYTAKEIVLNGLRIREESS